MFESFTDHARQAVKNANQVATQLCGGHITPEHILLGVLRLEQCGAIAILCRLGVDLATIIQKTQALASPKPEINSSEKLPLTPLTQKVVEYAIEEARSLQHGYVGTEHLLFGLLRLEYLPLRSLLRGQFGLTLENVRRAIIHKTDQPLQLQAGQVLLDLFQDAGAKPEEVGTLLNMLQRPQLSSDAKQQLANVYLSITRDQIVLPLQQLVADLLSRSKSDKSSPRA